MAETQKAMVIKGKELTFVDVEQETEIIHNRYFKTPFVTIKVNEEKLEEIIRKIKKQKSQEKKDLMADEFIQRKMKLNKDKAFAFGDYDENWLMMNKKIFDGVL